MSGNIPTTDLNSANAAHPTTCATHPTLFNRMKKGFVHFRETWGPLLAAKQEWDDEYNFSEGRYAGQREEREKEGERRGSKQRDREARAGLKVGSGG
ncbi:hypothetical protein BJX62DRAFT_241755 [Aspergillus germanicus]